MNASCDIITVFSESNLCYLNESIESIINQSRQDWIFHLISDCYENTARSVIQEFQRDKRIRIYRTESRLSLLDAISRIYDQLETGIILMQNPEDVSLPHRVETSLRALSNHSVDVFSASMLQFIDKSHLQNESLIQELESNPIIIPGIMKPAPPLSAIIPETLAARKTVFKNCKSEINSRLHSSNTFYEHLQMNHVIQQSTDVVAMHRLFEFDSNHNKGNNPHLFSQSRRSQTVYHAPGNKKVHVRDRTTRRLNNRSWEVEEDKVTMPDSTSFSSKIRVGYIYPNWTLGGTGRTVFSLMNNRPTGIEFTGMAIKSSQLFNADGQRRCGIHVWCGESQPPNPENYPGVRFVNDFQAACQILIDQSDVIILWGFASRTPEFDQVNWRGKPVVVTSHGSCEYTRKLLANLTPYATHFRAVSKIAAEQWGPERYDQVRIMYNGVDLNRITPLRSRDEVRREWGITENDLLLAHIGRLAPDKNPMAVAHAVYSLGHPWKALYVGNGYAEEEIQKEVRELLGDRVIFTGAIEQIGNVFAALDCFLMASPSEGHCQALNEAWAAGVPVVSTRVGAVPELEAEYGSLVVPVPIDPPPKVLATAVKTAISRSNRERIRRAQKMIHSRFTVKNIAQEFSEYIHEIAENWTPPDSKIRSSVNRFSRSKKYSFTIDQIQSETKLDCSVVMTASKPDLIPDALMHIQTIFPEYRELIIATAPSLPQWTLDVIQSLPRCLLIPGTDNRDDAAKVLYQAMDQCTGEWIVHVDDDDLWIKCDKNLVSKLPENTAVVTGGALYCNFHPDLDSQHQLLFGRSISDYRELNTPLNSKTAILPGSFRLTRRSAWESVRNKVPRGFEFNEYALLLCLLHAGYRVEAAHELWGVVRRFHRPGRKYEKLNWPDRYSQILRHLEESNGNTIQAKHLNKELKQTNSIQWTVGMTTAPRKDSTIEQSLKSLTEAGWKHIHIFAEPESNLPQQPSEATLSISVHDSILGAFPNWYLSLTELYLQYPRADAYLLCQDDVIFSQDVRIYLEQSLWPAPEIGVISLYCPSHEHQENNSGFIRITPGWKAWGALAYVFSNPGVREFLSDLTVLNHRHHGPSKGLRNIDSVVGSWCERRQLPYFTHVPTLAQHIGNTSTIWKHNKARGRRRAINYDPLLLKQPDFLPQNDKT